MSSRPWKDRIQDILDAIDEIQEFTSNLTFETFEADQKTSRKCEIW